MRRTAFSSNQMIIFFCSLQLWLLYGNAPLHAQQPFITIWDTDNGTNPTSITIPTIGSGYNYEVDWNNDGVYDQSGITGNVTHDFGTAGIYTIRIRGAFPRFYMNNGAERLELLDVVQWGDIAWTSFAVAFRGCANLNITATDLPNLSGVTSLTFMFSDCAVLNGPSNIGNWNTATIIDMSSMFFGATAFNRPIGTWNTSSVVTMASMFRDATSFNQPIGNWNTGSVITMFRMFDSASAFNQPIGNWNTASVSSMNYMFYQATAFNQPIGNWTTSAVTNMSQMFFGAAAFNQPIGNWNTASVTNMSSMFTNATVFNQDISNWNTALVTDMSSMFSNADAFNQPIGNWNTGSVTNMSGMFTSANVFNQPLANWNVSSVRNMSAMFVGAPVFNQPLANWDVSSVTDMTSMFQDADAFNRPIGNWNTSAVTNMVQMFYRANLFNQPLDNWDVSGVTNMLYMFADAVAFNQSLANWTLNPNVNLGIMLNGAGMSCVNYSATLNGWAANPATPSGRSLGATGRVYGTSAVTARTYLDVDKAWTITGDAATGSTCAAVLPVEWLSFDGKQNDRDVLLTWQTALETGNLGFQVERSADGSSWQQVGFVPARSENEDQPFYTFTDEKALEVFPGSRMLYYRLRQMEWNGGENLSIIVRIKIVDGVGTSDVRVFPNPVSEGALTLVLPETLEEAVYVCLMNGAGQVLRSATLEAGTYQWDVTDLPPGMYTVAVWGTAGRFFEKVMVTERG